SALRVRVRKKRSSGPERFGASKNRRKSTACCAVLCCAVLCCAVLCCLIISHSFSLVKSFVITKQHK
ncbi:hypothetical protein PNF27_05320, partial [Lactococcus garvieae]|nr:hypothetical protein [Lactococcus garvieae]